MTPAAAFEIRNLIGDTTRGESHYSPFAKAQEDGRCRTQYRDNAVLVAMKVLEEALVLPRFLPKGVGADLSPRR